MEIAVCEVDKILYDIREWGGGGQLIKACMENAGHDERGLIYGYRDYKNFDH